MFPQQLRPVLEAGGVVLQLAADPQAVTDEHRGKLRHQLLPCIAAAVVHPSQIAGEAGMVAGAVRLFMCPGGAEGLAGPEAPGRQ